MLSSVAMRHLMDPTIPDLPDLPGRLRVRRVSVPFATLGVLAGSKAAISRPKAAGREEAPMNAPIGLRSHVTTIATIVAITSLPALCALVGACDTAEPPTQVDAATLDGAHDSSPSDLVDARGTIDSAKDLEVGDGSEGHDGPADLLADTTAHDVTSSDAAFHPPASNLPFAYTRPNVRTPATQAELQSITTKYLQLLEDTRWFNVVDERVHGWPQSDPQKRYWYGTWWSGVTVIKKNGKVTYHHSPDGADNNGLRTAQIMEGAAFATLLWGRSPDEALLHKLLRGFSSWILAFKTRPNDPTQVLLARAAYPGSIVSTDGGHTLLIDYDQNHPGVDNGATEYVHIPKNPLWGDLYVKNKRSKDDIGHMFRAIAQVQSCKNYLSPAAASSLQEMTTLYKAWSMQVEKDNWAIATLDKQLKGFIPTDILAHFSNVAGAECTGMLALRLLGHGDPGNLACGNGISLAEALGGTLIKSGTMQMLRTYHEAAINQALNAGKNVVAKALLDGLSQRLVRNLDAILAGKQPNNLNTKDFTALMLHAAIAGVPLTSREVHWLHERIDAAYTSFRVASKHPSYAIFDPKTPDGTYPYEPSGDGFSFNDLALPLGTCASVYRNPKSRPLLDCAMVRTWR
ncbi:MAG: hypothetical protein KAI47_23140 [Deltaproteobacteria bacterium]|nr:hypothetical protein [Deltaproteobacteria bacterium]